MVIPQANPHLQEMQRRKGGTKTDGAIIKPKIKQIPWYRNDQSWFHLLLHWILRLIKHIKRKSENGDLFQIFANQGVVVGRVVAQQMD